MPYKMKKCAIPSCGKMFTPNAPNQMACPGECARARDRERKSWANLSEEELKQVRQQMRERSRKWRASLTPEQRAARLERLRKWNRKRRASLTPEQHERYRERERERYCEWRANLAHEELKQVREQKREYIRKWRANMTPEQRAAYLKRLRKWRASLTPEQRERYCERKRELCEQQRIEEFMIQCAMLTHALKDKLSNTKENPQNDYEEGKPSRTYQTVRPRTA